MTYRNSLRRFAAALAVAGLLAGCTTSNGGVPTPTPVVVNEAAQDVQLIASGLAAVLPNLFATQNLSASAKADIQNALAALQGAAANVQAAATPDLNDVQTAIRSAEAVIQTIEGTGVVPANVQFVIDSAIALLPVIAAKFGLQLSQRVHARSHVAPNQARLALKAAAAR